MISILLPGKESKYYHGGIVGRDMQCEISSWIHLDKMVKHRSRYFTCWVRLGVVDGRVSSVREILSKTVKLPNMEACSIGGARGEGQRRRL